MHRNRKENEHVENVVLDVAAALRSCFVPGVVASRISAMLFVFGYDEVRLWSEIFRRLIKIYSDA